MPLPKGTRGKGRATRRAFPKGSVKMTKTVAPAKLKDGTKVAVATLMKKLLNQKSETKFVQAIGGGSWLNIVSAIDGNVNVAHPALPSLSEGVTAATRVGDSIVPQSVKVRLLARLAPKSDGSGGYLVPGPRDLTCVVYYGFCKSVKTLDNINAISGNLQRLLDNGQDNAYPFGGNMESSLSPPRNELFDVKVKKFRLFKPTGNPNLQTNGTEGTGDGLMENQSKSIVLSFKTPSKLKYDATNYPTNYAPFFVIGYYCNNALTQIQTQASTGLVEIWWSREIKFKDM